MRRILGISGYLRASAIALLFASGCAQSEGERCQISSDCADGLTCQNFGETEGEGQGLSQGNGVCRPAGASASTVKDAAADAFVEPQLDADTPSTPSPDASVAPDTTALDLTPIDTGAID